MSIFALLNHLVKQQSQQKPNFFFKGNPNQGNSQTPFQIQQTMPHPVPTPQVFTNLQQLPDFTSSSLPYTIPNPLHQNRGGIYQGPAYFKQGGRPQPPRTIV